MRKTVLKCGLGGQRRTSFRRIELRLASVESLKRTFNQDRGSNITEIDTVIHNSRHVESYVTFPFPKQLNLNGNTIDGYLSTLGILVQLWKLFSKSYPTNDTPLLPDFTS